MRTAKITFAAALVVAPLASLWQQPLSAQPPVVIEPATQLPPGAVPLSGSSPKELPRIPPADAAAAQVAEGFQAEVFLDGLTYPTTVEFDDDGKLYVAEAGYNYGDPVAPGRILKVTPDGKSRIVADGLAGPVTDLLWHDGRLFISQRGKITIMGEGGKLRDLVTDLPSLGDHHNNSLAAGPDGKIYFGQGTVTNSGVVGIDNFQHGWLHKYPDLHDRPASDLVLRPATFRSANPLAPLQPGPQPVQVETAAFAPFGQAAAGQPPAGAVVIPGTVKANGTVLRMNPDGSNLEVFASGLRNPFGLGFTPDGKLLVTDAGYDERGSRPIANAPDVLWAVKQGGWYGFPDFVAGMPVTDPQFGSPRGPAPEFLMAEHPPVEKPMLTLPPHTGGAKFAFSPGGAFGDGQVYVGLIGDMLPVTGEPADHPGYKVIRLDAKSLKFTPFLGTKPDVVGPKGLEYVATPGPKRPVDVAFASDGEAMYVADIGAMTVVPTAAGPAPQPFPGTGTIWRITPSKGAERDDGVE